MLRAWLDGQVMPAFDGRILPIDADVARRCARLHVPDPRGERNALIAATALIHGMIVVTRNTGDFEATGVVLLNPWRLAQSGDASRGLKKTEGVADVLLKAPEPPA